MTFNVLDIVRGTSVDGPGLRTSIYLAGCTHNCPGCHNPESHDPSAGIRMTLEEIMETVRQEDFNVTLTGGDPLMFPEKTKCLVEAITEAGYSVWLYTGYTWEKIQADPALYKAVEQVETIVEGPFVESLRDITLPFRGSSNQRLIHPPHPICQDQEPDGAKSANLQE